MVRQEGVPGMPGPPGHGLGDQPGAALPGQGEQGVLVPGRLADL